AREDPGGLPPTEVRTIDQLGDLSMYIHATPSDFASTPVHGAYPADAPRVPVTLRLELTQEEAASVLATFSVGLHGDPHVTPADGSQILHRLLTDVVVQTIRDAALATQRDQDICPESATYNDWYRHLIAPAIPAQRAQNNAAPALTGTAVAR
ncbi:hypothetical protein ACFQ08_29115, partial [Streptosporangium algeriense]